MHTMNMAQAAAGNFFNCKFFIKKKDSHAMREVAGSADAARYVAHAAVYAARAAASELLFGM